MTARIAAAIGLVTLFLVGAVLWQTFEIRSDVEPFQDPLKVELESDMTEFSTSWTSGGNPYTVRTTCREGETLEQCVARFDAAVAALKAEHPPD